MTDNELRDHYSRIDQRFDGMQAQIDERFDGAYEVLKAQGNAIVRLDARVTVWKRRSTPNSTASSAC